MRLGNKEKPKSAEAESHDADLAPFDVYFSADVETDGPIPGPFSMLSFALVYAGRFDGVHFTRPDAFDRTFYRELKPISTNFEPEALQLTGLIGIAFAVKEKIQKKQWNSTADPSLRFSGAVRHAG